MAFTPITLINETNPLGPPADSGNNTPLNNATMLSIQNNLAAYTDTKSPSATQKLALAGADGTPNTGNEYLTKQSIGSRVQGWDAQLAAVAGVTAATDTLPYFTGTTTASVTGLTAFARTLLDDPDAATALVTLGVAAEINSRLSAVFFPEDYGAVGDGAEVNDGVMTSGSNALTSVNAAFTGADVGKHCTVYGAGAAGIALRTTISSVTSGTAHLAVNASTNVSAATVVWGTDDTDALQACIDATMTNAGGDPVIRLDPEKTYLVEQAPDPSHGGNCILYVRSIGFSALGRARVSIEGNNDNAKGNSDRPTIRTTRFEDTYFGTPTTTLNSSTITDTQTTGIVLADITGFPTKATVAIAFEFIHYTGITPGAGTTGTLTGVTRGYMQTTATAHTVGEPAKWTLGPPSVIGNNTEENGGRPTTFPFTDLISIKNIAIQLPHDPAIAGIDGLGWGGMYISSTVSADGDGPPTDTPTHPWAFGFRGPTQQDFGYVNFNHSTAHCMYCGYVMNHPDHAEFLNANANRSVIALGFELPTQQSLFGGGGHAIAGGYIISENNQYDISGWSPGGGAANIPTTQEPVHFNTLTFDIEDQGPGGSPIHINMVKDLNNKIYGNLTTRIVSGNVPTWSGGANIRVRITGGIAGDLAINSLTPSSNQLAIDPWDEVVKVGAGTTKYIKQGYIGRRLTLIYTASASINNNSTSVPAQYAAVLTLSGGTITPASGSVVNLIYDGTKWQQTS